MTDRPDPVVKQPIARVKLPGMIVRDFVPGANSWAQSNKQEQSGEGGQSAIPTATNRAKYEAHPTSALPKSPPLEEDELTMTKQRPQIRPATPFMSIGNKHENLHSNLKNRAATDPVSSIHQYTGAKPGVKGLLTKLISDQSTKEGVDIVAQDVPPLPIPSTKAGKVLGFYPIPKDKNTKIHAPPASAPLSEDTSDPFRTSSDDAAPSSVSPVRQANSTPIPERPTRRWMQENRAAMPVLEPPTPAFSAVEEKNDGASRSDAIIMGDGKLSPTKHGTYGRIAEVEVVSNTPRVKSHQGLVEHVDAGLALANNECSPSDPEQRSANTQSRVTNPYPGNASNGPAQMATTSQYVINNPYIDQVPDTGATLRPNVYSPSLYEGAWENDANLGYTLPQFTPTDYRQQHMSEVQMRGDPSNSSSMSVPVLFQGRPSEIGSASMYAPSFGSNNSWAHASNANYSNSYNQTNSAIVPPLFAHNADYANSVPPPPNTHPDFQPSTTPTPPALVHLETTMHYHLDACVERLIRHMTDQSDRVMDQIIRKIESVEERIKDVKDMIKDLKDITKGELREIRGEIQKFKGEAKINGKTFHDVKKFMDSLDKQYEGMEKKLEGMEKKLESMEKKFDDLGKKLESSSQLSMHERSNNLVAGDNDHGTSTGRSINTYAMTSQAQPAARRPSGNQSFQTTNGGRRSGNSYGRRSNTLSEVVAGRASEDRGGRRAYFAEMGRAMGPEPDIRQHPAFEAMQLQQQNNGVPTTQNELTDPAAIPNANGVYYQTPQYGGGAWYDQAYRRM